MKHQADRTRHPPHFHPSGGFRRQHLTTDLTPEAVGQRLISAAGLLTRPTLRNAFPPARGAGSGCLVSTYNGTHSSGYCRRLSRRSLLAGQQRPDRLRRQNYGKLLYTVWI